MMGCKITDLAKAGELSGNEPQEMCKGDCNGCPHYYDDPDPRQDDLDRLISSLRNRRIPCRRTCEKQTWPNPTFHLAIGTEIFHLTLRKTTFDLKEEIERGMK